MKVSLVASGIVLLAINAAAVYLPDKNLTLAAQTASAAVGLVCVFLAIRKQPHKPTPSAPTAPIAPPPPPPRPEAEIVA
ncbi:MAG: hypothetical protein ACKOAS_09620, partial [Verrucomicrobiota bacterium]